MSRGQGDRTKYGKSSTALAHDLAVHTNSSKFVLKDFEGYDIQRHHVDKDGTILDDVGNKEFREMIRGMLLRNVFVKFYFLEQDPN